MRVILRRIRVAGRERPSALPVVRRLVAWLGLREDLPRWYPGPQRDQPLVLGSEGHTAPVTFFPEALLQSLRCRHPGPPCTPTTTPVSSRSYEFYLESRRLDRKMTRWARLALGAGCWICRSTTPSARCLGGCEEDVLSGTCHFSLLLKLGLGLRGGSRARGAWFAHHGWRKQVEEMAKMWVTSENPETYRETSGDAVSLVRQGEEPT